MKNLKKSGFPGLFFNESRSLKKEANLERCPNKTGRSSNRPVNIDIFDYSAMA